MKNKVKKNVLFIFLQVFLFSGLFAVTYKATGTGATEAEAKDEALSSLSKVLYSKVKTTTYATQEMKEKNSKLKKNQKTLSNSITVTTDVPLLGVQFGEKQQFSKELVEVEAVLNSENANDAYKNEINTIAEKLESDYLNLSDSKIREEAISLYSEYEKFVTVASLLNVDEIKSLSFTRTDFDAKLQKYSDKEDSLLDAAKKITNEISKKNIFVYPVSYEDISCVTEFSYTLQQYVKSELGSKVCLKENIASYFLSGVCFEGESLDEKSKCLNVTYKLTNRWGRVISSSPVIVLLPEVYKNLSYIPDGYDFQKQLNENVNSENDFYSEVKINGHKDNVSFSEGDKVYIDIKVSEPCFIYIVGYVFEHDTNEKPFAYLYPFNENENGKLRFVKEINSDEANKWININPVEEGVPYGIEIIPPFGTEILQVYAVTEQNKFDFEKRIPDYYETDSYYMIDTEPSETLSHTRGLGIKKSTSSSKVVKSCESDIRYYTHE